METAVNIENSMIERLRTGDGQAWLGLYDSYAEKLWQNVSRLMPHDSAAVADIVQESFLAAARSARTYDPQRGSPWIWLWTIARRQMALHLRKQYSDDKLRQAVAWWLTLDGEKDAMIHHMQTPPQLLESRELAVLVRHCLSQLSAEYQLILLAKYVDDIPIPQIAQHTQKSAMAVRSTLARARKAFRRVFAKETSGDPVFGR